MPSHSSRKVLVSLGAARDLSANRFGAIHIRVLQANGDQTAQTLPVAVLARIQDAPQLSVGTMQWDSHGSRPALAAPVTNLGDVHLPLDGNLTLFYSRRQKFEFPAGFGRWLMPGQSGMLRFYLPERLPPGSYRYHAQIGIGEGRTPVTVEDVVHVPPETQPVTADTAF